MDSMTASAPAASSSARSCAPLSTPTTSPAPALTPDSDVAAGVADDDHRVAPHSSPCARSAVSAMSGAGRPRPASAGDERAVGDLVPAERVEDASRVAGANPVVSTTDAPAARMRADGVGRPGHLGDPDRSPRVRRRRPRTPRCACAACFGIARRARGRPRSSTAPWCRGRTGGRARGLTLGREARTLGGEREGALDEAVVLSPSCRPCRARRARRRERRWTRRSAGVAVGGLGEVRSSMVMGCLSCGWVVRAAEVRPRTRRRCARRGRGRWSCRCRWSRQPGARRARPRRSRKSSGPLA